MHVVTLDWETYYDNDITLKKMGVREYVHRTTEFGVGVKIDGNPPEWFSPYEFRQLAPRIWTGSPNDPFMLSHNARFDGAILGWKYGVYPPLYLDTAAMARALIKFKAPNGSVALDACAQYFGLLGKAKGALDAVKGKQFADLTLLEAQQLVEYCKHDAWLAWEIFKRLRAHFPRDEYHVIDTTVRMYLVPQFVLDAQAMQDAVDIEVRRKVDIVNKVGIAASHFRSRGKFADILRQHGIEPPSKTSPTTGRRTYAFAKTDPEMIALLNHPNPTIKALAEARATLSSSINETRATRMLHLARMFNDWAVPLVYYGTHTGRYSGDEQINALNFTRDSPLRRGIQAPPGHKVVTADLEQIEARIAAWWAGQFDLLEAFRAKVDVYANFAGEMFGIPNLTKATHPDERHTGKLSILQLGYGASARKFLQVLIQNGLAYMDAAGKEKSDKIVDFYRHKYSRIPAAWRKCEDHLQGMRHGQASMYEVPVDVLKQVFYHDKIELPNGLHLQYPALQIRSVTEKTGFGNFTRGSQVFYYDGKAFKSIYGAKVFENICQALARIVIMEMMVKLNRFVRPALQIHDALVWVIAIEDIKDFVAEVNQVMTAPSEWAPSLPLGVEVKIGDHL